VKIEKFKKVGKAKYKVIVGDNDITLYEDVIIKHNLLIKKNITLDQINKILEDNKYYEIYNIALSYIEIKMRNTLELQKYLEKKNFDLTLIDKVIEKLKREGYLSEQKYIIAFVNDKINLSIDGPYKIKQNLLNYKIEEKSIDQYLNTIDQNVWKEKLEKIIDKRKKISNKLSNQMFKNKTKIYLYNLGYPEDLIEQCLYKVKLNNNALEIEYNKAYKKYSKKYSTELLNYHIKNYLYRKGYTTEEINFHYKTLED